MKDAGTAMSRIFGGIKGALGNLQHTPYIGPKALNGGELIISSGMYSRLLHDAKLTETKMVHASTYIVCRIPLITLMW